MGGWTGDGKDTIIWDGTIRAKLFMGQIAGYIPYTGATANLILGSYQLGAGKVFVGNGTEANPSLGFSDDSQLGFYKIGSNNIGLSTSGIKRLDVNNSLVTTTIPLKINCGTSDNKCGIYGSTSGDTGDFFYFQGTNDTFGAWTGGNVTSDTSVSPRYMIRVHLKTSSVDWDGSMYVRDPPSLAPSPDTLAGGTCDLSADWNSLIIHKHFIGDTNELDFVAAQIHILYSNMDLEARKRFGLRTTKGEGENEINLTAAELSDYNETFTMIFRPDKWKEAEGKAIIEKEVNDRISWRQNKLKGIKVIACNPSDYGF